MPRRAKPSRSPWRQGPPVQGRVGNAHLSKKVTPVFSPLASSFPFISSATPRHLREVESTLWRIHLHNRIPIDQRVAPSRLPSPPVDDYARCQFTFVLRPSRFLSRFERLVTTETEEDGSSVRLTPPGPFLSPTHAFALDLTGHLHHALSPWRI